MKEKAILLTVVILLSASSFTQAQEGELSATIDLTWQSSYIWRGFDMYGESTSAIQPSVDVDLCGTGFGLNVFWSRARESGRENLEELRYTVYYGQTLSESEAYATDCKFGYTYYQYPDMPRKGYNMQEMFGSISLPNICPAGVVPSYTAVCSWPAEGNSTFARKSAGWLHIFGLGYDWTVTGLTPDIPEQVLHLSASLVYNASVWDFVSPGGDGTVDHDWSHALFGISTDFSIVENLDLTPAFYYQRSMDKSVNAEDECWVGLSMKYKF